MFKRLFWLTVGAGFGFGSSFWLMRVVRNTVERYAPRPLTRRVAASVRTARGEVAAAVSEGRDAMREREAELRRRAPGAARS